MHSRIADELKLRFDPVAVIFTDTKPEGAVEFKEGARGCVISLFGAAARGRTAAICRKTVGCLGGVVGLGFGCCGEVLRGLRVLSTSPRQQDRLSIGSCV